MNRIAQGYKRLQIKIGGRSIEEDIDIIHRVWEAVDATARLAADANRGLTAKDTLLLSAAYRSIPVIIEQPCNTLEAHAAIKAQISYPLYLDENTDCVNDVLSEMRACDGFGFKLTRVAFSISEQYVICVLLALYPILAMTTGAAILLQPLVHMGATVLPSQPEGVWIAAPYIEEHYDLQNPICINKGRIKVPTGFGLGLTLDPDQFGKPLFRIASTFFVIYQTYATFN